MGTLEWEYNYLLPGSYHRLGLFKSQFFKMGNTSSRWSDHPMTIQWLLFPQINSDRIAIYAKLDINLAF